MATRCASSPCATRRGEPKRMRSTSACSSTSSGRRPSRVTVTMLPGAGAPERARKIADGLRTSRRPCSPMWKNASSPTEPKRFLVARTLRKRLEASLSKYSTVSTRCSSTRGPAMAPSLVTWPTMMTLTPRALGEAHQLRGAFACSWVMAPAAVPTEASCTVWMESTISSSDALFAGARHHGFEIGVRDHAQVRAGHAQAARAHADLGGGFLGRQIQRGRDRAPRGWRAAAAAWICRCRVRRLAR